MTTRAAIGTLGLTLALLSPAPASAATGGTERPLNGTLAGLVRLSPATGSVEGEATGVMSHLGEVTASQSGRIWPEDGHYAGATTWSAVADNGDTLSGTAALTVTGPPAGVHTTTMVATITAGTGRFAGRQRNLHVRLPRVPRLLRWSDRGQRTARHGDRTHQLLSSDSKRNRPGLSDRRALSSVLRVVGRPHHSPAGSQPTDVT